MAVNILIVDDEKYNLDAIRRTLRSEKEYNLFFAMNGEEALEVLEQNKNIHLIITDQRMPGMSGIELLQKSLSLVPYAIRIILTAYTDVTDMIDAINKGHVYRYIIKPWDPDELKLSIKLALDYYYAIEEKLRLLEELKVKSQLLEKQNIELRKLADMKSRFLIVSSHELRTPATIISGSLELLELNSINFTEEQKKIMNNAITGSKRLNKIIETFFEMVKLDSPGLTMASNEVFFNDLIRSIVLKFKKHLSERNISLEISDEKQLWLKVDRKKIYLVFENLVGNAIKFTPDSGTISVYWEAENNEMVRIAVKDTGIGVPAEEKETIFDTFYQLQNINHHHTSDFEFMGGGPGLGLAICKQIIERHEGRIWVESEGKDKGSVFFVTLPYLRLE